MHWWGRAAGISGYPPCRWAEPRLGGAGNARGLTMRLLPAWGDAAMQPLSTLSLLNLLQKKLNCCRS